MSQLVKESGKFEVLWQVYMAPQVKQEINFSEQCMVVDRNTAMAAYTAYIGKFHPVAFFVREYADQLSAVAWLISS